MGDLENKWKEAAQATLERVLAHYNEGCQDPGARIRFGLQYLEQIMPAVIGRPLLDCSLKLKPKYTQEEMIANTKRIQEAFAEQLSELVKEFYAAAALLALELYTLQEKRRGSD